MNTKPTKIIAILALCLMAACGSSKSSSGDGGKRVSDQELPDARTQTTNGSTTSTTVPDVKEEPIPEENTGSGINFSENISEQEVANMLNEARRYSGTASDGLREYVTDKVEQEANGVQRAKNLKFASSIVTAKLKKSPKGKYVLLQVKIVETGKEKEKDRERTITYSGVLSTQKRSNKIELSSRDKDGKTLKEQKGSLICLDEGRPQMMDCQTKVAEITLNKAVARIILRKSPIEINADFGSTKCRTQECEDVYALFYDYGSEKQGKVAAAFDPKQTYMETFEVIQGRSAFNILIVSRGGEAMKMEGPLANPELYPQLDTELNRRLTQDELVDSATQKLRKTKMNESLNDVRLQANDGQGNLLIKVRMKVLENGSRDMFDLTVSRNLKQVRAEMPEIQRSERSEIPPKRLADSGGK